ncbi:MAG: discoidin domain-containing protein [Myxococcota bacterium]
MAEGRRLERAAWAAYAVLLVVGLAAVASRSRQPTTPLHRGAKVVASSFDVAHGHDPLFASDGFKPRDPLQKWASSPSDPRPWIELRFAEPVTFSRIRVVHAGHVEPDGHTMRDYRLSCAGPTQAEVARAVHGNTKAVAEHELDCHDVDRVRIDFQPESEAPRNIARVYEIEVLP